MKSGAAFGPGGRTTPLAGATVRRGPAPMPIQFVCHCGHGLRVKDELAGREVKCPKCSGAIRVPEAPGAQAAKPAKPAKPASAAATPTRAEPPAEWRFANGAGEQTGPLDTPAMADRIAAGDIRPDDLVWRTGWPEWRPAREAELPVPLPPAAAQDPPSSPPPLPAAAQPKAPAPVGQPASPPAAEPEEPARPAASSLYEKRRRRAAKRRRNLAIVLTVLCVILGAMLVWLLVGGGPAPIPLTPSD